jgi:four helix bundle protein
MYTYYFEKLDVWKISKDLVKEIYDLTDIFPRNENFGLVSQIRRSALSVPTNISEGCSRFSYKDRGYFYMVSYSSLMELLNLLIISNEIQYISSEKYLHLRIRIDVIANKLNALHKANYRSK